MMKRTSMISNSIYAISTHKYDNFGKLFYTNAWILINSAFGIAAQSITPEIAGQMGYPNLGQVLTVINYFCMMVSTMVAPTYMKRLPYRYQFFIHSTFSLQLCISGYFISICNKDKCSEALIYLVSIALSIVGGFIQGGLWVCQNIYISECTNEQNRSFFFGMCNALSNSAQMIGSVLSAFLIKPLGNINYFLTLSILAIITQVSFLFIREPPGHIQIENEQEYEKTLQQKIPKIANTKQKGYSVNVAQLRDTFTIQYKVSVDDDTDKSGTQKSKSFDLSVEVDTGALTNEIDARKAVLTRKVALHQTKEDHEVIEFFHELPITEQLRQIFEVATGDKIRPLIPIMLQTGLILGFEYGVFYKLISQSVLHSYPGSSDSDVSRDTFIVFGAQGVFEVLGGLIIGRLGQIFTINFATIIYTSTVQVAILITFINCFVLNYNINIVLGALWGFADCAGQANAMALLSEDWGDDVRVYGFYNFLQNSGGMLSLIISLMLGNSPFFYYVFIIIIWSLIGNFNIQHYRRERKVE